MLPRHARLRRRTDFAKVYAEGRFAHSPILTLHAYRRADADGARIGVVARRRLGKLARRAVWKRRVRAALEKRLDRIDGALDLIFVLRPTILNSRFEEIDATVDLLLKRLGALSE